VTIPQWLKDELAVAHPRIEIAWMPYGDRKVFVLPVVGDAFWRLQVTKSAAWKTGMPFARGTVLYKRHITAGTDPKWKVYGPHVYVPDTNCVTDARWVVFQKNVRTGAVIKLFDVVEDDGSPMPLDRRVLLGIQLRDGRHGAHDRAIKDVEEAPQKAEDSKLAEVHEAGVELFRRVHHDIKKAVSDHAVEPDPADDEVVVENA
jgi:hypothetical protein